MAKHCNKQIKHMYNAKRKQLEQQQLRMATQQTELALPPPPSPPPSNPVTDKLQSLSPEDMTPRQALEVIYELKALLNENR